MFGMIWLILYKSVRESASVEVMRDRERDIYGIHKPEVLNSITTYVGGTSNQGR